MKLNLPLRGLPPGNYTAIVSAVSGTGVALLEVTDLRNLGGFVTAASTEASMVILRERAASPQAASIASAAARAALELCAGVPLTVAVARR